MKRSKMNWKKWKIFLSAHGKKQYDYAWFTGHGNSFHTPTVDEIELHKIAVLIEKKTVLSYMEYCIS